MISQIKTKKREVESRTKSNMKLAIPSRIRFVQHKVIITRKQSPKYSNHKQTSPRFYLTVAFQEEQEISCATKYLFQWLITFSENDCLIFHREVKHRRLKFHFWLHQMFPQSFDIKRAYKIRS